MRTDGQPAATERMRRRVLVVDDERGVRETLEAILSETYDVTCASSAEEACRLVPTGDFDAVCTDFAMGGPMNGVQLLEHVGRTSPQSARILVTGQHEIGSNGGLYYVLVKPCDPQRLLDVIDRAVWLAVSRRKVATATAEVKRLGRQTGEAPIDPTRTGPRRRV